MSLWNFLEGLVVLIAYEREQPAVFLEEGLP